MKISHVIAVFKAEYYTTTSKFRQYRSIIPFVFLLGVLGMSYILRLIYEIFRGDALLGTPPIATFFSIIAIFTYFTLFAPLLSPLGRVVYDGGARSRREVALNAPVKARDLLYGNLLSNLAFFLPFFGFIGTLTLAPFIGNGIFSPIITSIALFVVLSILILFGLVAGTLISPLVFNLISSQSNSQVRAVVAFAVSGMLVASLPILRFFLENVTVDSDLGWITYLPFTLAAVVIVFILYGVEIGIAVFPAILLLVGYIILILVIGHFIANTIYDLENDQNEIHSANPNGIFERVISRYEGLFPTSVGNVVSSTMKASLRDIEHIARITIGLAITIFMIFALSSRGLFRNTTNFDDNIELGIIIFALILSSASVIIIEASSFTVQHRDMFALIKSAPGGARKFIFGKVIQMVSLLFPIFTIVIFLLSILGYISLENLIPLIFAIFLILIFLSSLSLSIQMINPTDNEEDLGNFINLLIFYLFAFAIAVIPVFIVISGFGLNFLLIFLILVIVVAVSIGFTTLAAEALDQMNLETLDSKLSIRIVHSFKTVGLFILTWNILPLFALTYFQRTQDAVGFLAGVYLIISLSVVAYYVIRSDRVTKPIPRFRDVKALGKYLVLMVFFGGIASLVQSFLDPSTAIQNIYALLPLTPKEVLILLVAITLIEEIYFRGMLLDFSRDKLEDRYAILLNAMLFALFHLSTVISIINSLIQALMLAKLKVETKSIIFPIIAHISYNLVFISVILFN